MLDVPDTNFTNSTIDTSSVVDTQRLLNTNKKPNKLHLHSQ